MECLFKLLCLCMYIKRLKSILKPIINTCDLKVVCVSLYPFTSLSQLAFQTHCLFLFSLFLFFYSSVSRLATLQTQNVLLLIHSNLLVFDRTKWKRQNREALTMKIENENCGGARKRFIKLIGFVEKIGCFR